MVMAGFEPTKHYVSDLKSDPFDRSGTLPHNILLIKKFIYW